MSGSTASRALNGKASVAGPLRKAVQDAIEQLGYVPDPAARALRSRKAGAIGALVADLSYEPLLQLVRAADERAAVTDAVADLLRTGHQRLLFANAASTFPLALRARLHVWAEACAETALRFDEDDIVNVAAPELAAALHGSLDDRKTCIVAVTQPSLTPTLRSLAAIGTDIPDDVSLIAFGDPDWAQAWRPPISVIARNMVEEGRRHLERLVSAIHGPGPVPAGRFSPSTYTRRASVH